MKKPCILWKVSALSYEQRKGSMCMVPKDNGLCSGIVPDPLSAAGHSVYLIADNIGQSIPIQA